MVKFNESHMKELETIIRSDVTSETVADILNIFDYAMYEGCSTICNKDYSKASALINFVADYCTTRNIEHDILCENGYFNLYLY
jgi:hypothetical protein